jgi:hypothetical protein
MMEKSQLCRDKGAADGSSEVLEGVVFLSRRDLTMIARHEMPGMGETMNPSRKGRYDFAPHLNREPN